MASEPIGLRALQGATMARWTPRRWNSADNRAPLLEFARKLKAQEKNDTLGREVASPTLNNRAERDFHEPPTMMRQFQELEEDEEDADTKEARQELEAEEAAAAAPASLDDSLIDEAKEGESDVDEKAANVTKNYDTDDQLEAGDLYAKALEVQETLNQNWEAEVAESDVDEADRAFLEANRISKERHQRLSQLADEEFRDSDKAVFAVIREYRKEPFQIWKTLKHEQLGVHLKDYHLYPIVRIFHTFPEARPLIPDLLVWARKTTKRPAHRRISHYAVEALLELDRGEDAVHELNLMQAKGIQALPQTRELASNYFAEKIFEVVAKDDLEGARKILNYVREERVFTTGEAYQAVVGLYIKHERFFMARDVLSKMVMDGEAPDKKLYAEIIKAYMDRGAYEDAADVLEEMDGNHVYAPRTLSQMVISKLKETGSEYAEEAEKAATFRYNLKHYSQQLQETYQV